MSPTKKSQKVAPIFLCESCNYKCSKKCDFVKHFLTAKHKILQNPTSNPTLNNKMYECKCGKIYKHSSTLYAHKKKCVYVENVQIVENKETNELQDLKEFMKYLIKENSEMKHIMMDVIKNGNINNINNTNTYNNSNNKTFNLQFFLNETCKDAMNLTDFVDSLQLQLCDLEKVGEVGYIEGISSIIVKSLSALDVSERPIHCTDKKRETMYVKDENKWEKEDEKKEKIHKMIKKISNKNITLISEFREKYPDYKKSNTKVSDQFNKIIIESMGGHGDNVYEKEEKIIKKIAKEVFVDKG
jgi:hypothetical protein